jgi:hypothetical protein
MNEYVLVEFMLAISEETQFNRLIDDLGTDFVRIKDELGWGNEDVRGYVTTHKKVSGKISSAAATVIKLSNTFLADRMRISYISNELKDKYRNR